MTPPEPRTKKEKEALRAKRVAFANGPFPLPDLAAAPNREDNPVRTVNLSDAAVEKIAAAVVAKLPASSGTSTPVTVSTATATAVADAVVAKLTPTTPTTPTPAPTATNPAATGTT